MTRFNKPSAHTAISRSTNGMSTLSCNSSLILKFGIQAYYLHKATKLVFTQPLLRCYIVWDNSPFHLLRDDILSSYFWVDIFGMIFFDNINDFRTLEVKNNLETSQRSWCMNPNFDSVSISRAHAIFFFHPKRSHFSPKMSSRKRWKGLIAHKMLR